MANPFDKFDAAPAASAPNPFDQFDEKSTVATPAPAAVTARDVGDDIAKREQEAQADPENSDRAGAFARGAERGTLPAAGGIAGAGAAMAAAAPLAGAAAAIHPLAGAAVELGAAAVGGMGGGALVGKAQQWALDHMPPEFVKALGLDQAQLSKDQADHPNYEFAGEMAPNLAAFRPGAMASAGPGASAVEKLMAHPITSRALPATIMGSQEAASEYATTGEVDPEKVAIAAAVGGASNKMTKIGHFLTGMGVGPVIGLQAALRNRGKGGEADPAGMRDITPEKPGPAPAGTPQLEAPIDPQDIHPGDAESPIPTSIIAEGRRTVREATEQDAQAPDIAPILARNGWPEHGSTVTLDDGEGPATTGIVHGAYNTVHPETGAAGDALQVRLDSGHMFTAFKHEMDAAGIAITPQQAQQAGLPLDIATQEPVRGGSSPLAPVSPDAATAVAETAAPVQPVSEPIPAAALPTTGDGTQASPIVVTHHDHVAQASELVNTAPTEAQKLAGNYSKAHLKIHGLDIAIENPKGSTRSGVDAGGKPWSVDMPAAYGYIKRTTGADGDQVDAYVGHNPQSSKVFVIDQKDAKTGAFDEHKAFLSFDTKEQAIAAYHAAFSDGLGPQRMGGVREMNTLQFKKLVNSGVLDKPVSGTTIISAPSNEGAKINTPVPESEKPILKTARQPLVPTRETSVLENIRRMGGIRTADGLGRPTKEGQDISAVLKDVNRPGLINNKTGQPPDAIRERLKEQGWFGGSPEHGTNIQHLYDLIDKEVRQGPQYHPESDRGRALAEKAIADDNARVLADVHDEAKKGGGSLTPEEAEQIVVNMGAHGIDPETAVADFIENKALREQYEDDAEETAHAAAEAEPVHRGTGEVDSAHGKGGEEPAPASSDESRTPEAGKPAPRDPGEAPSLKTEAGTAVDGSGKAVPQTIIPGADHGAVQLAKAREAQGHGRATTNVQQKDAGGMFAPKLEETNDLFAAPAKPAEPAPAAAPKAADTGKIEDFGDVLTGARKHYAAAYADRMKDAATLDIAAEPLSKSWPEPEYEKLLEGGTDPWAVAFVRSARDEIPTKPQKAWKLKGWVASVQALRSFSNKLIEGSITKERVLDELGKDTYSRLRREIEGRVDLYQAVGHSKSLKGVSLSAGSYSVYMGVHYSPAKIIWSVERQAKATAFGNMPRTLAKGDSRAEAITDFKSKVAGLTDEPKSRETRFDIFARRIAGEQKQFFIGKKVGSKVVELKTFDDIKAARAYLVTNREDLEKALERRKFIPNERKENNAPRVGIDHRAGSDVTPDKFSETFGFRGVQFGNYVEGGRRQADLNDGYDALMDMAGILDIPARAISLNGELGLAFGARGTGGIHAASAHYEPGTVVINLTKANGAGSLAHEWWHALDNYFARARGEKLGYVTEAAVERGEGVRPEMVAAFQKVVVAIKQTAIGQRSAVLDQRRSSPYWTTGREMAARAYESYVAAKLQDQSASNDYLANIVSEEYWKAAESLGLEGDGGKNESYPYPTAAEIPVIREAFDAFFKAVETRAGEDGKVPLFLPTPDQERTLPSGARIKIVAPQSPKFTAEREAVARDLRRELDKIGMGHIGLKISDDILTVEDGAPKGRALGVYFDSVMTVALNATDSPMETMNHEAIHALKQWDLFSKSEWSMLAARAKSHWRAEFSVDERWKGRVTDEDGLNEEAIAEAYRHYQRDAQKGIFARIFDRVRNVLAAIRSALRGRGFKTPEDVYGTIGRGIFKKVAEGKVGNRKGPYTRGPDAGEPSFLPANDQPTDEHQAAFDQAWDATIAASAKKLGWEGEPTSQAMFAKAQLTPKGAAKTELTRSAGLIKAMEDQRATPFKAAVTPINGTGETKTRGLSAGIEAKAVEKKLADSFGTLPEYRTVNMTDQAVRAGRFLDANYEAAKAVAMGAEPAPHGLLPESVLVAVERRAISEGDTETLRQLATNSALNIEATTMGQRIRALGERDPTSPVAAIKAVNDARQAAAKAKGTDPKKAKSNAVKDMLDAISEQTKRSRNSDQMGKAAKRLKFHMFLNSITCP